MSKLGAEEAREEIAHPSKRRGCCHRRREHGTNSFQFLLNAGRLDGASLKNHVNYTPGGVLCVQESTHLRTSPHRLLPSLILQLLLAMVSLRWRDTISFHRCQNDTTDYFGMRQPRRCHCCLPACTRSGLGQIMQINDTAELQVQVHGASDIDLEYYENLVNMLTHFLTSQRFRPRYLCLASRDG